MTESGTVCIVQGSISKLIGFLLLVNRHTVINLATLLCHCFITDVMYI